MQFVSHSVIVDGSQIQHFFACFLSVLACALFETNSGKYFLLIQQICLCIEIFKDSF